MVNPPTNPENLLPRFTWCSFCADISRWCQERKKEDKGKNREEVKNVVNAQEWLEQNYPDKETGSIYLNQQLEGVLDCGEYKKLYKIYISTSVDRSKFEIKGGSYFDGDLETIITPCIPAQEYINQKYPTQQKREEEKWLNISDKTLEGELDLSDFKNLEKLECRYNYLAQIIYPANPKKIISLIIRNNNINPSDLSIFSQFSNLERLEIGNENKNRINQGIYNRFHGSLEPLKDLKLRFLGISNTDIDSGWEYLPDSLEEIAYDIELRPNCKLALVKAELEKELWKDIHQDFVPKYKKDWLKAGFSKEQTKEWIIAGAKLDSIKFLNWFLNFKNLDLNWALENEEEFKEWRDNYENFGTCYECNQPNTSYEWCQSCNAKHFQQDFGKWTSGNSQIDKFIQKCQSEATSAWNILEWIPYEKFKNIEHIADGGFGKVYKAEWEGGSISRWDNEKKEWKRYKNTVALKTLSNSQNLDQDFLQELTLYKMFRSSVSKMVPCYGISKDTEGSYIMVMKYMWGGNLRECLRKNRELDLKSKLEFLKQIIQGLKDIHRKHLVHRDFHSGNIIVDEYGRSSITDLGLSKPADEKDDNQVYGIIPYVAPEVLMGNSYTQAADIYSLGMIMYEIITGIPPFAEQAHDTDLALKIIRGERPQFPKQVKYPQLLIDLIKQCWEQEPDNRPAAREVSGVVGEWIDEDGSNLKEDTKFYRQYKEIEDYHTCQALTKLYQKYRGQFKEIKPESEEIEKIRKELYFEFCQKNNYDEEEVKEKFRKLLLSLFPRLDVKVNEETVWHSKKINTKQIIKLLAKYQEQQTSKDLELNLFEFDELTIQEEPEQTQIEIPPK
ncbi:MAG: hypothetical protein MRERV_17c006 [Mycoplasmataceae bacterium RV_VA103A]|nr:MAG: hypothetical protein MRERV_17c006 [Mycoplasmataceae bacterium RV_VA103A]